MGEFRVILDIDYAWLEAKLATAGLNALLADFDAVADDPELRLVEGALRASPTGPGSRYSRLRSTGGLGRVGHCTR